MKIKRWQVLLLAVLTALLVGCESLPTPTVSPSESETPTSATPTHTPTTETTGDETTTPDGGQSDGGVNWCAHEHLTAASDKAATCTTDGYKNRKKCTDCGAVLENTGTVIPAYGHEYNNRKCIYCAKNKPSLVISGQYENSGVIWQLYDDGELAISGKGAVPSFPTEENSYFFGYNKAIKSIVVYNGVTEIGDNAFRNLKDATTISISSTVKSIGDHAFDGWSLKTLNLSYGLTRVGKDNFTGNQIFFLELPASITSVGAGSFSSAQMVTLRIPASVKTYEAYENQYSNLRNVAFMGDESSAKALDLYRHLRCDGECANVTMRFKYTEAASKLPYCTKRGQTVGDFTYCVFSDGTAAITGYKGSKETIEIPELAGGNTVVGIDREAFKNNKIIRTVTLPASVTGIYPKAFIDSSLTELIVKGEHLTVGNAAFQGCSSFNTLEFEGTFLDVGAAAFAGTGVGNIKLDPSMKVARTSAFATSAIKDVDFTAFEIISGSAFARTSFTDVDLTGVREVGYGAFYNAGVKNLNVTNVGHIAHAAFVTNSQLKKENVVGLESVKEIDEGAFPFEVD